jgi:uncharacterized repeat protein (TIGR03803 family)
MKTLSFSKKTFVVVLFCAATMIGASAQTLTSLMSFDKTDGYEPSSLVQGSDGNLYGVTYYGGVSSNCPNGNGYGCGTIFRVTPAGALTVLYAFCSQANCADGSEPLGSLVQGANGSFYGVTQSGGVSSGQCGEGCGTVFEITPTGKLTSLHSFCSQTNCADGLEPLGGIAMAGDGAFYGTTGYGGANRSGTVFAITPGGKLTTLHSFCAQTNCPDGSLPTAALVQATDGKLYGSTDFGGTYNRGTIFSITTAGKFATLHIFNKGINPMPEELIQSADGNLYGTTASGGLYRQGTVFRMTPSGTLTYLHSFCAQIGCTDGYDPQGLVQGNEGNFYGTSNGGSASYGGTVFEITPTGSFNILYDFCAQTGCPDGAGPRGLMQATNGNFYGVTSLGGVDNDGTVFVLSTGLGPFVEAIPKFSSTGKLVYILGNNLTGTTSVTFNGTAATFSVASDSYIKATVPSGATTGTIKVATPSGTLSSNAPFHVIP